MGVAVLQAYPVLPDKTAAQVVDILHQRITNLGATHTGQFVVDCDTYYSSQTGPNPQRVLHVLHNSEQPATVYSVIENQNKVTTFTSDTLLDLLILKLGNIYSRKFKIESKGSRYEVGDFLVKLGVASAQGSFKGILVEVEYLPCVDIHACWGLLCEFMQGFLGSVVAPQLPPAIKKKPGGIFTPVDTIQQYLEHFRAFHNLKPRVIAAPHFPGTP